MPLEAVYYDQITYGRHPHHLAKFPAQEPLRHPEWIFRLSKRARTSLLCWLGARLLLKESNEKSRRGK